MRGLSWQQLGGAVLLLLQGQVALSALSVQVNSKGMSMFSIS